MQSDCVCSCQPSRVCHCVQVAEERAISGSCGNPLCGNACTFRPERTVYRPTPNGVVQVPEPARLYCSQRCRVLIQHYADKLGDPMLRLKPEAVKKSMVSHRPRKGPAGVCCVVVEATL